MKTKKTLSILLLLATFALIFTACQDDFSAEPIDYMDAELKSGSIKTVPFSAHYTTYPDILDDTGGILVVDIPGEGNASHLGASTWFSHCQIDATVAPPWVQVAPMIFVHKNRPDTLFGYYDGFSAPLPENPFHGWGDYEITSGTGKYKGITGHGTYKYIVSPEMVGDLEFTGVLEFPKERKKKPHHRRRHR